MYPERLIFIDQEGATVRAFCFDLILIDQNRFCLEYRIFFFNVLDIFFANRTIAILGKTDCCIIVHLHVGPQ
jgi:hypothetical protein